MIRVVLPHACFGLIVDTDWDGRYWVCDAAPIARWAIGKPARQVWDYYARRGRVEWIP